MSLIIKFITKVIKNIQQLYSDVLFLIYLYETKINNTYTHIQFENNIPIGKKV